ncbi:MAG: hypothetical protein PHP93_06650, partial [Kiritimatiellales bacterium]|nr:hypothetical protein [Kiritimatiellales bacterium]
ENFVSVLLLVDNVLFQKGCFLEGTDRAFTYTLFFCRTGNKFVFCSGRILKPFKGGTQRCF